MSAPCPTFAFVVRMASLPECDSRSTAESLREMLEANGLTMSARNAGGTEIVINRDGSQATDADRQLVLDWATRHDVAAAITVSDLIDLNAHT